MKGGLSIAAVIGKNRGMMTGGLVMAAVIGKSRGIMKGGLFIATAIGKNRGIMKGELLMEVYGFACWTEGVDRRVKGIPGREA